MTKIYIPVAQPMIGELESSRVNDALCKGAISGFYGEYIAKFENDFAQYSGCSYGVATSSGTTAVHLALLALSIGRDDEVLVSTLTNMATCFPILYQGAKPVPIDIEKDTLNIDPQLLEEKITQKTKAILVVHLFGHPVDMDPIVAIAKKHNLFIIEDCAQAHGALYKGRKVGGIGDIGCFSFYANKIITTGEGGMVTTNDKHLAERARNIKNLAFGHENKFQHTELGYNYRMTNLQAALGCAQFEKIESIIRHKRRIAQFYNSRLKNVRVLQLPVEKPYARSVYWMYHVGLLDGFSNKRKMVMKKLSELGIETREGFLPYNMQQIFIERGLTRASECPRANDIGNRGFYIPSGPNLTNDQLEFVASHLESVINSIESGEE